MDVGGTSPWMGEGRTMQEQLSRITHDCRDAGGRATQETKPRNSIETTVFRK